MWVVRKKVMNHFWTRWQADYLATLSIDKKWLGDGSVLKAGDVVILRPETLEKNQWRMARVTEVLRKITVGKFFKNSKLIKGQFRDIFQTPRVVE